MNSFLVIGNSEELIDENFDEIIVVDNSFNSREWSKSSNVIESPWLSVDYAKAHEYIFDLRKRLLEELSLELKKINGVHMLSQEWDLIMGMRLNYFLFSLYDKYLRLEKLRDKNVSTIGYYQEYNKVNLNSIETSDPFNTMLYSFLCEEFGISISYRIYKNEKGIVQKRRTAKKLVNAAGKAIKEKDYRKHLVKRFLLYPKKGSQSKNLPILTEPSKNCEVILLRSFLPNSIVEQIELSTKGKIFDFDYRYIDNRRDEIQSKICYDKSIRDKICLENFKPQNQYEECVIKILKYVLPLEVIEGFSEYYNEASRISEKWNVKRIYSSVYLCGSFLGAICCVLAKRRGAKLINIQHSAVYGLNVAIGYFERELQMVDEFLTWGWMPDDCFGTVHIRPVAINRIPQITTQKKEKKKILYTSNLIERHEAGRGGVYDNYVSRHFDFINALDKSTRKKIVTRCYTSDMYAREYIEEYKKNYSDIKLESLDSCSFSESAGESALIVSDNYGSTHIESMIMGIPTMLFLGWEPWIKNQQVLDLLEKLRVLKVYAKTPEEAAKNVMEIDDYEGWWNQSEVQEGVKEYLNLVARGYDRVQDIWKEEFLRGV